MGLKAYELGPFQRNHKRPTMDAFFGVSVIFFFFGHGIPQTQVVAVRACMSVYAIDPAFRGNHFASLPDMSESNWFFQRLVDTAAANNAPTLGRATAENSQQPAALFHPLPGRSRPRFASHGVA